jgi:hypothetical protein
MINNIFSGKLASITNGLTNNIYTTDPNNPVNKVGVKLAKTIGGTGGIILTIVVLVIAICLMVGAMSPKSVGKWWLALASCFLGAVVFYSAWMAPEFYASLFG